ncbi:hypothetical protein FIV00_03355 [Labrenzia sp. THAF82]|nr:hypothetical protein FIV00_02850 [Labrenzia sp. THAF82]QFT29509.1 hypothetical protein FIV00_03355 [Labrenzia sp. THAF82]
MTDQAISTQCHTTSHSKTFPMPMAPGIRQLKAFFSNHRKQQIYRDLLCEPDSRRADIGLSREEIVAALRSVGGNVPLRKPQAGVLQPCAWS